MFERIKMLVISVICMALMCFNSYQSEVAATKPTLDLVETELMHNGYKIVPKSVGKSEFAEIFLAQYKDKLVCLKCMFDEDFSENEFAIFQNQQIKSCKNITQIIEKICFKSNLKNITVLVMEYNPDKNIFEKWSDLEGHFNKYDEKSVFKMFVDIAHALKALHESGYVYKDIKPQNIMLNQGNYKLIDFGAVLSAKGRKDGYGCWLYKAPEFILYIDKKVDDYDAKVDVWSLAVMVCHLFEGKPPYECFNYETGKLLSTTNILENQKIFCQNIPYVKPGIIYHLISKCIVFDPQYRINSRQLCILLDDFCKL